MLFLIIRIMKWTYIRKHPSKNWVSHRLLKEMCSNFSWILRCYLLGESTSITLNSTPTKSFASKQISTASYNAFICCTASSKVSASTVQTLASTSCTSILKIALHSCWNERLLWIQGYNIWLFIYLVRI